MTPTPIILLIVALFWTLPASAAAYMYRKNGNSVEDLAATLVSKPSHAGSGLQKRQRDAQTLEA